MLVRQGSRLTLLRRMQSSWRAGLRNGARLHGERVACDRETLTHGIQAKARIELMKLNACSYTG